MLLRTNHNSYHLEIIANDHDFTQLESEWDELLRECSYISIELTYSWFAKAWEHYKNADKTARLHILRFHIADTNVPIAILPLMISKIPFKRFLRINQLSFLCYPWSDYCGFIIRRQFEEEIVAIFVEQVLSNPEICSWDILLLKNISQENVQTAILLQKFGQSRGGVEVKHKTRYYHIPTQDGQFESYYQGLSDNFKNNLRKAKNRLERFLQESSGDSSFDVLSDISETDLELFLAMNRRRQMSVQRLSAFESRELSEFTKEFILQNIRHVSIFVLTINRKTAAFVISFAYNGSIKCWISGIDASFDHVSPGQILFDMMIRYCFQKKMNNFDFGIGSSAYKAKWTQDYFIGYQIRKLNPQNKILNMLTRFKQDTHISE
jgi:CelD/BcsL family acetyltransferase involved in cellulose biosynthesis